MEGVERNMARDAVVLATLQTLRNWGVGFLIAGILMGRYLSGTAQSGSDFVVLSVTLLAIVLAGLWFRWNRPLWEDRTVWRVFALLVMVPTPDLATFGAQIFAAGGSFEEILANQSLLIFFPFLFWGGRFVVGSGILAFLRKRPQPEAPITVPEISLFQIARRAVRRLSLTGLLILLWGIGAILNLALLLSTSVLIRESAQMNVPIDRMVWFQYLGTLVPMVVAGVATLGMGILETWQMFFRRTKLHTWWSGRTFLRLSRGLVFLLMVPMLGDVLIFGSYFVYPIRVVVGIVIFFVIGRQKTYAAMGLVLAETMFPTNDPTTNTTDITT